MSGQPDDMTDVNIPPEEHVKVLDGQGWVGLIDSMGTEASIVNAARVSFGKLKKEMDAKDVKLLKYLIDNRHTSPLEHVAFTFSVHCPLFVRGQWHRHRTWSYNEISRRYTEFGLEFHTPVRIRRQAASDRQASVDAADFDGAAAKSLIAEGNQRSLELYDQLLSMGVCREQARGVLPQNMMVTFWGTVNLNNLIKFLELRDTAHAQWEIRQYAKALKKLVAGRLPNVAEHLKWTSEEPE